jgi:hypothetical protein
LREAFKTVWGNVPLAVRGDLLERWAETRVRLVVRVTEGGIQRDGVPLAGCFREAGVDSPAVLEFEAAHVGPWVSDRWLLHVVSHELAHFIEAVVGVLPERPDVLEAAADEAASSWGFPCPPLRDTYTEPAADED